jgi:hypothetical protein
MAGVKSTNIYAIRFKEGAYGEHRGERFVEVQNIKFFLGQDFPYLNW